jgi:hypothetical protein
MTSTRAPRPSAARDAAARPISASSPDGCAFQAATPVGGTLNRQTCAGAKGPAGRVPDIVGIGDLKDLTNAGAWLDFDVFAAHLVSVPQLWS